MINVQITNKMVLPALYPDIHLRQDLQNSIIFSKMIALHSVSLTTSCIKISQLNTLWIMLGTLK